MNVRRRTLLRAGLAGVASVAGLSGCQSLGGSGEVSQPGTPTLTPAPDPADEPATPGELRVSWTAGPDMPLKRTQTTAVGLGGELYVIGGIVDRSADRHVAVYSPDEERWRTVAPPPEPVNHTSAVAYDRRIHVFGGYSGSFLGSPPLDVHWIYDPGADEWTDGPALPTARGALVANVADGRIFTIGGATAEGTTGLVEAYDPATESWTTAAAMPTAREHLAAGVIDDRIYVAAGRKGLSRLLDATEVYDPASDSWTALSPIPTARAGIAGDVLDGRLFVFGGEEVGEQVFEEVEVYHPPDDAWTPATPLPTPRWGLGVATIGDRIYTVGGGAVPSAEETRKLEILSMA